MKILFLSARYRPERGGVETHTWEIAQRLKKKGHKVTVITEKTTNAYPANVTALNFGPAGFNKKFRIWQQLWTNRHLLHQTDIIHCHDVFFWYLPFRFLLPRKPVYTTFHGYETQFPLSRKVILIRKLSEQLSWGTIIVGDYIRTWYGANPDEVVYGGISEIQLEKKPLPRQGKLRLALVGRLEKDLGINTYIETLKIIKKKRLSYSLDIYGDGSLRKNLEKYGKVHGFIADMSSKMRSADIVFASSYLLILEALALGKRVIAVYDNPLKKDYLLMSPLAPWIRVESDPKKITQIIERRQWPVDYAGLKKFLQRYDWDKITDIYLKLWSKK